MKTIQRPLAILLVLFAPGFVCASVTPARATSPHEEFMVLKERLPGILVAWAQACGLGTSRDDVRVALFRSTSEKEAKLTIIIGHDAAPTALLTMYLQYHGEVWTTTRSDPDKAPNVSEEKIRYLMLAIDRGKDVAPDEAEEKAVQALKKDRNTFDRAFAEAGMPVRNIGLCSEKPLTADDFKHVTAFKRLRCLDIRNPSITDDELKNLAGLQELETVALSGTKITDAGLKVLSQMKQLKSLYIHDAQITDAGLKELATLNQLRDLRISKTNVTDEGLKALSALDQLQFLDLDGTAVTDTGLKHLLALKQLRTLDLRHTNVTVAGLKQLAPLAQLQKLHPSTPLLGGNEVEELKKALPKVSID